MIRCLSFLTRFADRAVLAAGFALVRRPFLSTCLLALLLSPQLAAAFPAALTVRTLFISSEPVTLAQLVEGAPGQGWLLYYPGPRAPAWPDPAPAAPVAPGLLPPWPAVLILLVLLLVGLIAAHAVWTCREDDP
jgi:hypothetical protein